MDNEEIIDGYVVRPCPGYPESRVFTVISVEGHVASVYDRHAATVYAPRLGRPWQAVPQRRDISTQEQGAMIRAAQQYELQYRAKNEEKNEE